MPGLLVSALALGIVFCFVDFSQLVDALLHANLWLIALSVGVTLAWLWVRALAWRCLLEDRPPVGMVFFAVNEGYLLNNLFPLRLGEVGRAYLLSQKAGLSFWQTISSILVERIFDLAFTAGLALATLPLATGAEWARPAALTIAAFVLAGLGGLFILASNRARALDFLQRSSGRWPVLLRLGGGVLPNFLKGLAVLADGRRFIKTLALVTLNWGIGLGQYYILITAFLGPIPLWWAALTLSIVALGVAAPSSPANVGVLEGAALAALAAALGQDPAASLAFALTMHLLQIIITVTLGAGGLAREGESLLGLYHRIRNLRKPVAAPNQ